MLSILPTLNQIYLGSIDLVFLLLDRIETITNEMLKICPVGEVKSPLTFYTCVKESVFPFSHDLGKIKI